MRKSDVYGTGKFLKAAADGTIDVPGNPLTLQGTIQAISTHEFDDGRSQRVIHFAEELPDLGLNVTNWTAISAFTGKEDDDEWIGTVIEMFVVPEMKSQTKHAIRVRKPSATPSRITPTTAPRNGNGATNDPQTAAARNQALEAFKLAHQGQTVEQMTPAWQELLAKVMPGKTARQFTAPDWLKLKAAIQRVDSPFEDAEPAFADIDVPF